eukprot:m.151282 g.151282  ORF g.151282 m.151282 type:complete len:114 (+) comp30751_c2_seq12:6663-7004(+)
MSASQLREQGAEYRALLEARDLEDVLYGGATALIESDDDDNCNIMTAPLTALDGERSDSPDSLDKEGAFDDDVDDDDDDDDDDTSGGGDGNTGVDASDNSFSALEARLRNLKQ